MSKRVIGIVLIGMGLLGMVLSVFAMEWLSFWHSFPRPDGGSYAEVHPLQWRALVGGVLLGGLFTLCGVWLRFPRRSTDTGETGRRRQNQ